MTLREIHLNMTFTCYTAYGKPIATTHDGDRDGLIDIIFQDGSQRKSVADTLQVEETPKTS